MSTEPHVWIHPGVLHGTPCIGGTRIPIETVARIVGGKDGSVDLALASYPHLTRAQVLVACWYAVECRVQPLRSQWLVWLTAHGAGMWEGRWDDVPNPPAQVQP